MASADTEIRDLLLGVDGVPVIKNGDLVFIRGKEGMAQNIATALALAEDEWWLNPDGGVPLFSEILVKNPRLERIRASLVAIIVSVPGVASVDMDMAFNDSSRELTVNFTAYTEAGQITDSLILNLENQESV